MATGQRDSSINTSVAKEEQLASLTKMLLCVIMIFVICNSASGITIWSMMQFGGWDPSDVEIFSCIPLILNSSVNFIIYVLLGSKFRMEFKRLISVWKRNICRIVSRNYEPNLVSVSQTNSFPLTSINNIEGQLP